MAVVTQNKQALARIVSHLEWDKGGLPYHAVIVYADGKLFSSACTSLTAAACVAAQGEYWLVRRCAGPRAGQFVDRAELDPVIAEVKAGRPAFEQ